MGLCITQAKLTPERRAMAGSSPATYMVLQQSMGNLVAVQFTPATSMLSRCPLPPDW